MKDLAAAALLAALVTGSTAAAQTSDDDDWDVMADPAQDLVMASAYFANGIGLATRCRSGAFDVLIAGLPHVDTPTRLLHATLEWDGQGEPTSWTVGTPGTVAMSHYPAQFARALREGGELNIVVPGYDQEPDRRYVLPLPPSSQAIEDTLAACDRPLVDRRDAQLRPWVAAGGVPTGMTWARRPSGVQFPDKALNANIAHGTVVMSCVTDDRGRLNDCIVESEHPSGFDFDKAVRRSIFRAQLEPLGEGSIGGRIVSWRTNFRMQ